MQEFIQHYVNDMDESLVQRCIFCGEILEDYRNVSYSAGPNTPQGSPKGWPAGTVFIVKDKFSLRTDMMREVESPERFKKCVDETN